MFIRPAPANNILPKCSWEEYHQLVNDCHIVSFRYELKETFANAHTCLIPNVVAIGAQYNLLRRFQTSQLMDLW